MSNPYEGWLSYLISAKEQLEVVDSSGRVDASVVVCRLAPQGERLILPDNLVGHCSKCFRLIQYRPHVPSEPVKMCDECIMPEIERQKKAGEDVKFMITKNTARDLVDFAKRKKLS